MREYCYDHVHLRSSDPDETARFLERNWRGILTSIWSRSA